MFFILLLWYNYYTQWHHMQFQFYSSMREEKRLLSIYFGFRVINIRAAKYYKADQEHICLTQWSFWLIEL